MFEAFDYKTNGQKKINSYEKSLNDFKPAFWV